MKLQSLGLTLATALACSVSHVAAAPSAFIQPDPATNAVPFSAIKITRDREVIPSNSELKACDKIDFVSSQSRFSKVVITTTYGGKNLVLDAHQTSRTIPCASLGLDDAVFNVWKAISTGERAAEVATATKGSDFELPVFSSASSSLAAGRRALYVSWVGGRPPFRVLLTRGTSSDVVAELKDIRAYYVRLPEVDLKPGQYSLAVANSAHEGEVAALQEDHLFVVPAGDLPAQPSELRDAKLAKADADLLFAFYLEGLSDGRWTFEAMQWIAGVENVRPAARDWLRTFSGPRKP